MARTKGAKQHRPTKRWRRFVLASRVSNVSVPAMLVAMDISEPTLYKYYGKELAHGRELVKSQVVDKLLELCMEGEVPAIKFLMERKFGWIEKLDVGDAAKPTTELTDAQLTDVVAKAIDVTPEAKAIDKPS